MTRAADPTDLEALERFVVENDELLELEERIGRFNVFDALRIERVEIRHSNFLAWLLDPNGSHGQGDLFLKAVLMDMLKKAREAGQTPPLSPVLLDGVDLHAIEIRREWKNLDLLIRSRNPPFVVVVENKIDSGEHSKQLDRYAQAVHAEFGNAAALFVFLAASGQEASDESWIDYSYVDLHRVLSRVKRTAAGSLGADVAIFLEHYLGLIGSRFMNDAKIEELCRRIYSNHRRAVDLIFENVGTIGGGVHARFAELVRESGLDCEVVLNESRVTKIVPRPWLPFLPPLSVYSNQDARSWLAIRLDTWETGLYLQVRVTQTTSNDYRNRIVEALTTAGNPFGFRISFKRTWRDQKRITLYTETVVEEIDNGTDEEEKAAQLAFERLKTLLQRIAGVREVLARVQHDTK